MLADPLLQAVEAGVMDAAGAHAAQFLGMHQAALLEDLEVLPNRSQGDALRLGQARDRCGRPAQAIEDRPPRRVAQGVEEPVDGGVFSGQSAPCCGRPPAGSARSAVRIRSTQTAATATGFGIFTLALQLFAEAVQEGAPAGFATLRAVRAFIERALVGAAQLGAASDGEQFDRDQ